MSVRLLIVLLAFVPDIAGAALQKCVIDGKTQYQDRPCSDEVSQRGTSSTIGASGVPYGQTGPATSAARLESARRDMLARGGLEMLARQAFAAFRSGQLPTYADFLCPKARTALSEPQSAEKFRAEAKDHASRRVELLDATGLSRVGVTFLTREAAPRDMSEQRFVKASFEWPDGTPCLLGIESWSRQRAL